MSSLEWVTHGRENLRIHKYEIWLVNLNKDISFTFLLAQYSRLSHLSGGGLGVGGGASKNRFGTEYLGTFISTCRHWWLSVYHQ